MRQRNVGHHHTSKSHVTNPNQHDTRPLYLQATSCHNGSVLIAPPSRLYNPPRTCQNHGLAATIPSLPNSLLLGPHGGDELILSGGHFHHAEVSLAGLHRLPVPLAHAAEHLRSGVSRRLQAPRPPLSCISSIPSTISTTPSISSCCFFWKERMMVNRRRDWPPFLLSE